MSRRFHFTQTTRLRQRLWRVVFGAISRPFGPRRRTPLHVAFTPPVETFCARRFGVDSKGLPLAKKPDGDVSDMEWIRPGTAEDRQKIVACLIKRKCDPNKVDYHDHSALHYACVWGWVPTVDLLLEEGADPECSNIGAISASRGAVGGFVFEFEAVRTEFGPKRFVEGPGTTHLHH